MEKPAKRHISKNAKISAGVIAMLKNVMTLKGFAKRKGKVISYITERFKASAHGSTVENKPDGFYVSTPGTWYESRGRVKVTEQGNDLLVTIIEDGAVQQLTYILGCVGLFVTLLLGIVVFVLYMSEKNEMSKSFMQNCESVVNSASEVRA